MKPHDPHRASILRRRTSRTYTAREPLADVSILFANSIGAPANILYAGPAGGGPRATNPFLGAARVAYPIDSFALQLAGSLQVEPRPEAPHEDAGGSFIVLLDLGENREVARIEMYGNLLLPPREHEGRPMFNFGLPRRIGVAVAEMPTFERDLHDLRLLNVWQTNEGEILHRRYENVDFRADWGWTAIHLPPTYGRFLVLYLSDLPLVLLEGRRPVRGMDIQRLVVYPFLDDVDHRPTVECVPVASRQSAYSFPSAYWSIHQDLVPQTSPQPATHQSLLALPGPDVFTPGTLAGCPVVDGEGTPLPFYSSDLVRLDSDEAVVLVLGATTDEIPLLSGVRLTHFTHPLGGKGGELPSVPGEGLIAYRVRVDTTNDEEAARSADADHPSWRTVTAETRVSPLSQVSLLSFVEPTWARYVRLVVRVVSAQGAPPKVEFGRFWLSGVQLVRPRDFVLTARPGEDLRVDHVLLRLRGPRLLDDYAFADGTNGLGLTLSLRRDRAPALILKRFRTLLDLVENSRARVFSNSRTVSKPVQKYVEIVNSEGASTLETKGTSEVVSHVTLPSGKTSVQVTQSGVLTTHTDTPGADLEDLGQDVDAFTSDEAAGVVTDRQYAPSAPPPPPPDLLSAVSPQAVIGMVESFLSDTAAAGYPVSLGIGGGFNAAWNPGISVGGGLSISGSISLGGGTTHSEVSGSQGSVVETQTGTLHLDQHQETSSESSAKQSREASSHDERTVLRTDLSDEVRKRGVAVRYGGADVDFVLVAVPIDRTLRGDARWPGDDGLERAGDILALEVHHVPEGVVLDVEFRGVVIPKEPESDV